MTSPYQIIPSNSTAAEALIRAEEQMLAEEQQGPTNTPKHTEIYDAVHAAFAGLEITPGSKIH